MPTTRNTYSGGLDSDTSNAKIPPNRLRDLVDFRVSTDEGKTSLALTSIKGTSKLLSLPSVKIIPIKDGVYKGSTLPSGHSVLLTEDSLPQYHKGKIIVSTSNTDSGVYDGNTLQYSYYSNQDTHNMGNVFLSGDSQNIIGWTNLREDLVVFTSSSTSSNPASNTRFCIWKISYTDDLSYTIQLMYIGNVAHSSAYQIESISKFENSKVQKVYWTDTRLTVKHFNLAKNSPQDTWNSELEFTPSGDYYAPSSNSFIGGEPTFKGMCQYAYSLYNRSGAESRLSPLSLPIYVDDKIPAVNFWADKAFENARIYRIYYANDTDGPVVTLMEDRNYNPNSNNFIEFTDNGQVLDTLSLTEFANIGGEPRIIQSLTEKDNRMILGGIKEQGFYLDWDGRAYRFNSSNTAEVFKADGNDTTGYGYTLEKKFTTANYPDTGEVEGSFDCFNLSNLDRSVANYRPEFQYQANGSTIGGEGPNIKYSFGVGSRPYGYSRESIHSGWSSLGGSTPAKGYKRMEIYRFGIQFMNEYGQWSFVEWIGDIKFPTSNLDDGTNTFIPHLNVTIKNYPAGWNNRWKWRIVRAPRETKDRTIATQGVMMQGVQPTTMGPNFTANPPEAYANTNLYSLPFYGPGKDTANQIHSGAVDKEQGLTADDGINYLLSHEGQYINIAANAGDYMYPIAYTNNLQQQYRDEPDTLPSTAKIWHHRYDQKLWSNFAYTQDNDKEYPVNVSNTANIDVANKIYKVGDYETRNSIWNQIVFIPPSSGSLSQTNETYIMAGGAKTIAWQGEGIPNGSGTFYDTIPNIIDYRVVRRDQYGGFRHNNIKRTTYIPCSDPQTGTNAIIYGGDTTTAVCRMLKGYYDSVWFNNGEFLSNKQIIEAVLETTIMPAYEPIEEQAMFGEFKITPETFYGFDSAYKVEQKFPTYISKPINFNEITDFDYTVRASEPKFNNEVIDSYTRYLNNTFLDMDAQYGPIKRLINFNDEVVCLQSTATSQIIINPRVQTQASDGRNIELGFGGILHDKNYISTKSGTLNKFSVFSSKTSVYYYDTLKNKIMVVGKNMELSDAKNMHGYLKEINNLEEFKTDRPLYGTGVIGAFDSVLGEALFVFKNTTTAEPIVLIYKEKGVGGGNFSGKYRANPYMLMSDTKNILSVNPLDTNTIHIHNRGPVSSFYGSEAGQSYVHLVINDQNDLSKVFDNFKFNMEAYTSNGVDVPSAHPVSCRVYNDYQDSGIVPFTNLSNIARLQRTWEANIPRQQNSRLTMRGPWLNVILYFDNSNNYTYVMHDLYTTYRA